MRTSRLLFSAIAPCVALLSFTFAGQVFAQEIFNYSTFVGSVGVPGSNNATGTSATFSTPTGVAVDSHYNVYIADTTNNLIRVSTPAGVVSTLAGSGTAGQHNANGTSATFAEPKGIAVDSNGNVFVADTFNNSIRRIDTAGNVTTYAGSTAGTSGSANSNTVATAATFASPTAVAVDTSGNVYVADTGNNLIRKIAPGSGATVGGVVTTIAGASANLDAPGGIAVDSTSGNVYVADTFNDEIRVIAPGGGISTLAGQAGATGTVDGTGTAAEFYLPVGIALGSGGNLFVADSGSGAIRKVTESGVVTTIGGQPGTSSPFSNGTDSYATFKTPQGIAVEAGDIPLIADAGNDVIRDGVVLATSGDITGAGMPDIFWTNTSTNDRGVYIMDGTSAVSWAALGNIPAEWRIAAVADFTGSGNNDILWEDTVTGDCGFWMMDGLTVTGWRDLGTVPTEWKIAAVGNFHGTGSNDILWQNTSTGECGFYVMSGTTVMGWVELAVIPLQWEIVGAADFNGDGKPDIMWRNTSTGECGFYLMNGMTVTAWAELGTVLPLTWDVAAVGDFNGDGHPDILWENSSTGEVGFYLMNGTTATSWVTFGTVPTQWVAQPE